MLPISSRRWKVEKGEGALISVCTSTGKSTAFTLPCSCPGTKPVGTSSFCLFVCLLIWLVGCCYAFSHFSKGPFLCFFTMSIQERLWWRLIQSMMGHCAGNLKFLLNSYSSLLSPLHQQFMIYFLILSSPFSNLFQVLL